VEIPQNNVPQEVSQIREDGTRELLQRLLDKFENLEKQVAELKESNNNNRSTVDFEDAIIPFAGDLEPLPPIPESTNEEEESEPQKEPEKKKKKLTKKRRVIEEPEEPEEENKDPPPSKKQKTTEEPKKKKRKDYSSEEQPKKNNRGLSREDVKFAWESILEAEGDGYTPHSCASGRNKRLSDQLKKYPKGDRDMWKDRIRYIRTGSTSRSMSIKVLEEMRSTLGKKAQKSVNEHLERLRSKE
jgi:outer membrane biosynthesis protein TonB